MSRLELSILAVVLSILLASFSHSASLPEPVARSRSKRQSADVRAAEYLAWIALGGNIPRGGCIEVACGVVDVYQSGKKKRDFESDSLSDEDNYSLLRALVERAAIENSAA
ncbi:hypothetical protein EGW08_005861 [Elysia chlorotica]|uniref:Uncharacterized protein n=1 Tax=Elysia chlorotica TaxID=188477 RepID=A0A3S0ZUW1_ELYCH|nr:hypothetical protein EGW08_005861 [Elysia chlorotica]